jgi:DNA-binding protein Fis
MATQSVHRPATELFVSAVRDSLAQLMSAGRIEQINGRGANGFYNLVLTAVNRKFYFDVTFRNVNQTPFGIQMKEAWFVIHDGVPHVSQNNHRALMVAVQQAISAQLSQQR